MITVQTDHPLAVDSDDHLFPEGIYYDNSLNIKFVESVENFFKGKKINFLDLGCAGGALSCEMHKREHTSIGLEGSDHALNVRPEMVKQIGKLPEGFENWQQYANNVLFTCDVTKEYTILKNDEQLTFDLITCWDVMEHFHSDEVENFLSLVYKHLKVGGLFVASIALYHADLTTNFKNSPENLDYHHSVFPKEWWEEKLSKYLTKHIYPFNSCNRDYIQPILGCFDERNYIYCGIKL
jgi:cyclopropane fatty-acyl-phospholipid synthase-like methyltransferase